jgi:hypothetical protein
MRLHHAAALLATIGSVHGQVSTTDVDDPTQLASTMIGSGNSGISIIAARKIKGSSGQFGIFQQNGVFASFPATGIILSTGQVKNVVGPNSSTGKSTINGGDGDADLNNLLPPGTSTNDAAVLEIDFTVAKSEVVSFQYVFGSEEYTEFIGQFNDVFAFFLNGKNIALLPNGDTVSIDNVNCGAGNTNPAAPNCGLFVNNEDNSRNTQLDGFTKTLTAQGQALAGQTNTLKIAVADTNDSQLDSMVLIAANSFQAGTKAPTKAPGQSGKGGGMMQGKGGNMQGGAMMNAGKGMAPTSAMMM